MFPKLINTVSWSEFAEAQATGNLSVHLLLPGLYFCIDRNPRQALWHKFFFVRLRWSEGGVIDV